MSESRISELKNKLMKVQEESLKDTQKLLDQTLAYNQWAMDTQKQYMKMETELAPRLENKIPRDASIG